MSPNPTPEGKDSIQAQQQRLDMFDDEQDGRIDVGDKTDQTTETYIKRVNEVQMRLRGVYRKIDAEKDMRSPKWQQLEAVCQKVEIALLERLALVTPSSLCDKIAEFNGKIDEFLASLEQTEVENSAEETATMLSLRQSWERLGIQQERAYDTQFQLHDAFKAVQRHIDQETKKLAEIAKNANRASQPDVVRNLRQHHAILQEYEQKMAAVGERITMLELNIVSLQVQYSYVKGNRVEAGRMLLRLKERYGNTLQEMHPGLWKRAIDAERELRNSKQLTPFDESLLKDQPEALHLAVKEQMNTATGSIDLLDQYHAWGISRESTSDKLLDISPRTHVRPSAVFEHDAMLIASPFVFTIDAKRDSSLDRKAIVTMPEGKFVLLQQVMKDAPEHQRPLAIGFQDLHGITRLQSGEVVDQPLIVQPSRISVDHTVLQDIYLSPEAKGMCAHIPFGHRLVLRSAPREVQMPWAVPRIRMLTADDLGFARVNDDELFVRNKQEQLISVSAIHDLQRQREEASRDVLRFLDRDSAIRTIVSSSSAMHLHLQSISTLLTSGNTDKAEKADEYVSYVRAHAKPLLELMRNPEFRKNLETAKTQLSTLKQADFGFARGGIEREIDERVNALDAMIGVLDGKAILSMCETIMDNAKFHPDTWEHWLKHDGPQVLAAIVVGTAATVSIVMTCGGAAPLWAMAAAGAAGGMIGSELAAEGVRLSYRSTQDGVIYSARSRLGAYVEGAQVSREGVEMERNFLLDVANPYAQEFLTNFLITFSTMGAGRWASGKISKLAQNSRWVQSMTDGEKFNRLTGMLGRIRANYESIADKSLAHKIVMESLQEVGEEAVEAGIQQGFNAIDARLGVASGLVLATFQGVRLRPRVRGFSVEIPPNASISDVQNLLKAQLEAQGHATVTEQNTVVVTTYNGEKVKIEFVASAKNPFTSDTNEEVVEGENPFSNSNHGPVPISESDILNPEDGSQYRDDNDLYTYGDPIAALRQQTDKHPGYLAHELSYAYKLVDRGKTMQLIELFDLAKEGRTDDKFFMEAWERHITTCIEHSLGKEHMATGNWNNRDVIDAIELQEHFHIPVSERMRIYSVRRMCRFCQEKPEFTVRFVRAFNVSQEALEESKFIGIFVDQITPYKHLAQEGLINIPESAVKSHVRESIARSISLSMYRDQNVDHAFALRSAYDVSSEDFENAAQDGLCRALSQMETTLETIHALEKNLNITLDRSTPRFHSALSQKCASCLRGDTSLESPLKIFVAFAQEYQPDFSSDAEVQRAAATSVRNTCKEGKYAQAADVARLCKMPRENFVTAVSQELKVHTKTTFEYGADEQVQWCCALRDSGILTLKEYERMLAPCLKKMIQDVGPALGKEYPLLEQLYRDITDEKLREDLFSAAETDALVKTREGYYKKIAELEQVFGTLTVLDTPHCHEPAKQGMVEALKFDYEWKNDFQRRFGITAEERRDCAQQALNAWLEQGVIVQVQMKVKDPEMQPFLKTASTRSAACNGIRELLESGHVARAADIRDAISGLTDEELLPSMIAGVKYALGKHSADFPDAITALRSAFNIKSALAQPDVREVLGIRTQISMKHNDPDDILLMRKHCDLTDLEASKALTKALSFENENLLNVLQCCTELPEGILRLSDKETFILGYVQNVGIPSIDIYREYCILQSAGDPIKVEGFASGIRELLHEAISSGPQDSSFGEHPHYQTVMDTVFPNHANNWCKDGTCDTCRDRSSDIAHFTIRGKYTFHLAEGVEMRLKDGMKRDDLAIAKTENPIADVQRKFSEPAIAFEKERMLADLDVRMNTLLADHPKKDVCKTREEKMFLCLLDTMVGKFDESQLKELMIGYQFAVFEDIRAYLEGTRDRAAQSKNQDYAHLLEMREFFADHLKEVSRTVAKSALANEEVRGLLPEYFQQKSAQERDRVRSEVTNRLQLDKLGLSDGFVKQLARTLKGKTGKDYPPEKVRAIVARYERRMPLQTSGPQKTRSKAFQGQLDSQRNKTIAAMEELTGETFDPAKISLGDLNLAEFIDVREKLLESEFDENLFGKYLTQAFQDVFAEELSIIDAELAKFQPVDKTAQEKQMRRVECFISKNRTSAYARRTAGVCVSGDNPDKGEKNQWDMPNYFQMIIRDPMNKICQGCVLLHMENDGEKKILTASFNPSSTYLFKVDEVQMFKGLLQQLTIFAEENNIDMIAVSKNQQIRTNRTGGQFEQAMNDALRQIGESYSFSEPRQFSYSPAYQQQEVDILWKRKPK